MATPTEGDAAPPVYLTGWGNFVMQHTVSTPISFWTKLMKEVEGLADEDADWEFMIQERIAGLDEFLVKRRHHGEVKNW